MTHIILALPLAPDAPSLLEMLPEGEICSPFGRWVRGRIGTLRLEWPRVAIDQVRFTRRVCHITLIPHDSTRALFSALVAGRGIAREIEIAAGRAGWMTHGAPLWQRGGVLCGGDACVAPTEDVFSAA